jgi:class 3 adenylate cyclase
MADLFNYRLFRRRPGKFVPIKATVMFIDVVGFTTKGDNKALRHAIRRLQETITDVFDELHWDEEKRQNDVIMLPTGDGYGIAFEPNRVSDIAVLGYAAKLSKGLAAADVPIRMGINNGPCWVHTNLNDQLDVAGWGIIDAQRAMTVGEKNHILCTDQFAQQYVQAESEPHLHAIGTYTVKQRTLTLFNYFSKTFGNPRTPPKKKES